MEEGWLCVEGCAVLELGRQSGVKRTSGQSTTGRARGKSIFGERQDGEHYGDTGTAARFFMQFGGEDNLIEPVQEVSSVQVINDDCLQAMRRMPDACIDSIITDPPSGISFMQARWDTDKGGRDQWIAWLEEIMVEALRVVKPGAHALVWTLPRTSHWTATALENAGWEIRDRISHIQGAGFPKSLNIQKAARKAGLACKCQTPIVQCNGEVRPENVRVVRQEMAPDDALPSSEKQDLLTGMQPRTPEPRQEGEEAQASPGMSVVRENLRAEKQHRAEQGEVLRGSVLRQMEGFQPGDMRAPEEYRGQRQGEEASGQGDGGREEPSVEGRGDVQAEQGQLHRPEVHPMPEGISTNGTQGRVHNGASSSNGEALGAPVGENGSGASHRPRHPEQRDREPTTLQDQRGAQTCGGCGKPIVLDGLGSALKPAVEDWWLVRKPLSEKNLASNVLKWGTGGLNIDQSRVSTDWSTDPNRRGWQGGNTADDFDGGVAPIHPASTPGHQRVAQPNASGRFPSNLLLSHVPGPNGCVRVGSRRVKGANIPGKGERGIGFGGSSDKTNGIQQYADPDGLEEVPEYICAKDENGDYICSVALLDEQSGNRESRPGKKKPTAGTGYGQYKRLEDGPSYPGDQGGASRFFVNFSPDPNPGFFYCAKSSKRDRSANGTVENGHPTCKPTALMRYLLKLVTPENGTCLDPFAGSGTTGVAAIQEGFNAILIEQDEEYCEIAERRCAHALSERRKNEVKTAKEWGLENVHPQDTPLRYNPDERPEEGGTFEPVEGSWEDKRTGPEPDDLTFREVVEKFATALAKTEEQFKDRLF